MAEAPKPTNPLNTAIGIFSALVGWGFSKYTGSNVWIPGFCALALLLLFTKTSLKPRFFTGALIFTIAHIIWYISLGAKDGNWNLFGPDIVILAIVSCWLWIRPSLAPAVVLGIVHLVSLGVCTLGILSVNIGSPTHKYLSVHCLFRVLAISGVIMGYINLRKAQIQD